MTVPELGLRELKRLEGFREFAYPDPASKLYRAAASHRLPWGFQPARDLLAKLPPSMRGLPAGPWTCGYGETKGVDQDTRWSEPEASHYLRIRYEEFQQYVLDACTVVPNENQLIAMTLLCYNIGPGWQGSTKPKGAKDGFRQSSVLRAHNRGDTATAIRSFGLWNKAGGVEVDGLTKRRALEASIYARPMPDAEVPPMPQTVDGESSMAASPINRAGVVAGGTAAVATVAETARTISDVKYSLASLGDWLVPILLIVVVGMCGFIIWERTKQRRLGWA